MILYKDKLEVISNANVIAGMHTHLGVGSGVG